MVRGQRKERTGPARRRRRSGRRAGRTAPTTAPRMAPMAAGARHAAGRAPVRHIGVYRPKVSASRGMMQTTPRVPQSEAAYSIAYDADNGLHRF